MPRKIRERPLSYTKFHLQIDIEYDSSVESLAFDTILGYYFKKGLKLFIETLQRRKTFQSVRNVFLPSDEFQFDSEHNSREGHVNYDDVDENAGFFAKDKDMMKRKQWRKR